MGDAMPDSAGIDATPDVAPDSGAEPSTGDSSGDNTGGCSGIDGGNCQSRQPGTLVIIGTTYSETGTAITYGIAPDLWDVSALAGPGENPPQLTATAGALSMSAILTSSSSGPGWVGAIVSLHGAGCLDETNYAEGVQFTLSGDLGGCLLYLDAITSPDQAAALDACRGGCLASAGDCALPSYEVSQMGSIAVPNASFSGGVPEYAPDVRSLIGFRWRLEAPEANGGSGCAANITIANVELIGI
jgi:hypothetical protein